MTSISIDRQDRVSEATPKVRLLLVTHSAVLPTGMAEVMRLTFGALLHRYPDAYTINQLGLNHVHAVVAPPWPIHPTESAMDTNGGSTMVTEDLLGERTLPRLLISLRPHIVIAFNDPQKVRHICTPATSRSHKVVAYVNFDGFPCPPGLSYLHHADRVITMSSFALKSFLLSYKSDRPDSVGYVYSPADINRFHPISKLDRAKLRAHILPRWISADTFLLGWIGRNQWRKQIWVLYPVIQLLRSGQYLVCNLCGSVEIDTSSPLYFNIPAPTRRCGINPSGACGTSCALCHTGVLTHAKPLTNVVLWLHMPADGPEYPWPVKGLEAIYDVRPGRDIHYTEGLGERASLTPDQMPMIYQMLDCLLYLSGGEGFGVPTWEAMSTGIPTVYTNYSSHAELLTQADAGLPVGGLLQPEPGTCALRIVADVREAVQAVRKLYFDRCLAQELGARGRRFCLNFAPETQAETWHRILMPLAKQVNPL